MILGVVRDVTVDNLVTAVGNIDTSTLAQDSTLQDVATAIGNISGGNDPVTNTTVNTLCKDTTGQDIKDELTAIKSAVQGLGTALGSDKANINGDNISNPSAFRSAISAAKNSWTLLANIKVTTNTSQQVNLDITGYSEFLYIFGTNTASNEINYARSYVMPGYGTRVNDNYYSTATYSYSSCARVSNVSSSSFTINIEEVTMGSPYQTNGLRFILMAR